ncbi:hypothetical protein Tco_0369852 [Tanacetum coccineum]
MKTTIEIGDEFVKILQDNAFNGIDGADVVNHIAKVLEILEWIKIPNVDKDKLRLHVFLISLSGHAKEWWDDEIKGDCKEDTAYQRLDFTRKRAYSIPNTTYPTACIRRRMAEKSFVEIQGTFLVKIRDNTLNGIIGENAFKHIDNFLEVVGPLKVKGLTQDRFRLNVFPISLAGAAKIEADDPDDIAKIFKIKGNLFDYETPLCKAFNDLIISLKSTRICLLSISKESRLTRVGCMTYFHDHKWYDELVDGKLKVEASVHKAKVKGSWGDATPGVMKFCAWLKSSFENFHELDHDVLVKLEESWWKVNAHEVAPFTRWKNYGHGSYANAKTKKAYDPYLDINRIFGRNYGAANAGNTQDNQEHKKEHHDPSTCRVRRFEMIKYSFDADDEHSIRRIEPLWIRHIDMSGRYQSLISAFNFLQKFRTFVFTGSIQRILGFGIRRIDYLYRPCCKEIDDMIYSKKTCVELVRAILTPRQHTFAQELKLENHLEQHIRGVPRSNSISHLL